MLQLRPNCECCDRDLPYDSREAMICTFECTFCADCADTRFQGTCPHLRRRTGAPPDEAGEQDRKQPTLDGAGPQAASGMRGGVRWRSHQPRASQAA